MPAFRTIVLLSLNRWENEKKPGTGYELRVVHSIQDGKSRGVGVEKVYFYADGAKTIGKPLQRKDFSTIKQRWVEVLGLMDNPPEVPPPAEPEPLSDMGLGAAPLDSAPLDAAPLEQTDF